MTCTLMALLIAAPPSDTLESLLARGPLVSVETDAGGKFDAAVGFLDVAAPLDRVWQVLTGFGAYREFVPRVVKSEMQSFSGGARVKFEIESPGPNTKYVVQYALDEKAQ